MLFLIIENLKIKIFLRKLLDNSRGECKIFCVNEKIHTKKEVPSVE